MIYSPVEVVYVMANSFPPRRDLVKDWYALGDSYSAGPGADKEWDNEGDGEGDSGDCM